MKKATKASVEMAWHINNWLTVYVPLHVTGSDNTLKSYKHALCLYISFLEKEKNIDETKFCADCFQKEYIEQWLEWIVRQRHCSDSTRNNRLASIRAFLKYLAEKDVQYLYLQQSASRIKRKRTVKKKVYGLTRSAVKAILNQPDQQSRTGRRDLTLLILMYNTAARLDEILSLKLQDIQLTAVKPYITVTGKGAKVRTLYLFPKTVEHLKKYLTEFHGTFSPDNAYLFYSRNTGVNGKMTQTAINKRLKLYAVEAQKTCTDVPLDFHAHQLRHARALHWLEDGMNIVQISFLLGHEQIQTTMVYLDITTEQELAALDTLKDDVDRDVKKKWKPDAGLAAFCGLKQAVQ